MISKKVLFGKYSWKAWLVITGLSGLLVYVFFPCGSTCSVDYTEDDFQPDVTVSMKDTTPKTIVFPHTELDRELAKWWIQEYKGLGIHCGLEWVELSEKVKAKIPVERRGIVWSIAWSIAKNEGAEVVVNRLSAFSADETEWNDAMVISTIREELAVDGTSRIHAIRAIGKRQILINELQVAERSANQEERDAIRAKLSENFGIIYPN